MIFPIGSAGRGIVIGVSADLFDHFSEGGESLHGVGPEVLLPNEGLNFGTRLGRHVLEILVDLLMEDVIGQEGHELFQKAGNHSGGEEDVAGLLQQGGELVGDQITGTGYTLFKSRVRNSDIQKGKRSGYRLIYWLRTSKDIILVTIYSKLDQGDISTKEIRRILKLFQGL